EAAQPQRRRARQSDLPSGALPLLDAMVEARLLVRDRLQGTAEGETVYEVAHEALLRRGAILRQWISGERATLTALEGARQAARDWDQNGRANDWLVHKGDRLVELLALMRREELARDLGPVGDAYATACRKEVARAATAGEAAVRALFHPWRKSDGRAWW